MTILDDPWKTSTLTAEKLRLLEQLIRFDYRELLNRRDITECCSISVHTMSIISMIAPRKETRITCVSFIAITFASYTNLFYQIAQISSRLINYGHK